MNAKNVILSKPGHGGKFGGSVAVFVALILPLTVLGCFNGMMPNANGNGQIPNNSANDGKVKVRILVTGGGFGDAQLSRTVMATLDTGYFDEYNIHFEGIGANAGEVYDLPAKGDNDGVKVTLEFPIDVGEWEITVTARKKGVDIAEGRTTIVADPDDMEPFHIGLKPIFTTGQGTFSYIIESQSNSIMEGGTIELTSKMGGQRADKPDQDSATLRLVIGSGGKQAMGSELLDVGVYDAVLTLETEGGYSSSVTEVVWIYRNATSEMFYDVKETRHALVGILQESWKGSEWRFIEPAKMMKLMEIFEDSGDIGGFKAGNYATLKEFEDTLTPISANANPSVPMGKYTIDRFRTLLDAALILRAQKDERIVKYDKRWRDHQSLESLVTGIVKADGCGSSLSFGWDRWNHFNETLPVKVGGIYEIELTVNWAYIVAEHGIDLLQTGKSGIVKIKLDSGHIDDEDGEFAFTENSPGSGTNTINITGLPSGVTIDDAKFTNTVTRSGGKPWGDGYIYLAVDENVAAGRFPISISLGTDKLVGDESFVCVQDLTITPDYVAFALFDTIDQDYVVTGEGFPYPGTYTIKVPGNGSSMGQVGHGLKTTVKPFVVGEDGKGRGEINIAGPVEYYNPNQNGKNTIKITVNDLETTMVMDRVGKKNGKVWAEFIGADVRGKAGENVTVSIVAENYLMYPDSYYAEYHPGSEYKSYHWIIESLNSDGSTANGFNTWDPGVTIPEDSGVVLNEELSTWHMAQQRLNGGDLVLTLGEKKGRYKITVWFGLFHIGPGNDRTYGDFWLVVE